MCTHGSRVLRPSRPYSHVCRYSSVRRRCTVPGRTGTDPLSYTLQHARAHMRMRTTRDETSSRMTQEVQVHSVLLQNNNTVCSIRLMNVRKKNVVQPGGTYDNSSHPNSRKDNWGSYCRPCSGGYTCRRCSGTCPRRTLKKAKSVAEDVPLVGVHDYRTGSMPGCACVI